MENTSRKKLFLMTLAKTIVFFASVHLIILTIQSIQEKNLTLLNVFSILGIQSVLPLWVSTTSAGHLVSLLCIAIVYCTFFFFSKQKKKS